MTITAKSFIPKAQIDKNSPMIITGVRSYIRQSDNQEVSTYEVALPEMGYEKAPITVDGKPIISEQELSTKPAGIMAKFVGLEFFPAASIRNGKNGAYAVVSGIAGTATSIKREG